MNKLIILFFIFLNFLSIRANTDSIPDFIGKLRSENRHSELIDYCVKIKKRHLFYKRKDLLSYNIAQSALLTNRPFLAEKYSKKLLRSNSIIYKRSRVLKSDMCDQMADYYHLAEDYQREIIWLKRRLYKYKFEKCAVGKWGRQATYYSRIIEDYKRIGDSKTANEFEKELEKMLGY